MRQAASKKHSLSGLLYFSPLLSLSALNPGLELLSLRLFLRFFFVSTGFFLFPSPF